MNKIIKYGMLLVAVLMAVLSFVLAFVSTSTNALITTVATEYNIGSLFDLDAGSATAAAITAIVAACFVGLTVIAALLSDLKVAELNMVAKVIGVLAALAGIACLVSTIVLSVAMADGILVSITSTDVIIGFAPFGALLGGVLACGGALLPVAGGKKKGKGKGKKRR